MSEAGCPGRARTGGQWPADAIRADGYRSCHVVVFQAGSRPQALAPQLWPGEGEAREQQRGRAENDQGHDFGGHVVLLPIVNPC
jgi:hypothetical protein